jgi:predicted dehydrogenase
VPSGPIRVAIVGTGSIARIHAAALGRGFPEPAGAALVAAADIDANRLGAFAREHGVPATYRELDDLLRDAHPDLVHICTPPHAHHGQALACLRAGVSVLVEKPPVISLREFDELAEAETAAQADAAARVEDAAQAEAVAQAEAASAADRAGPWFASVYQHRFGGGQRRLKAMAADGSLGRPLLAVCHTTWFRDQAYFDAPWRGRWETEGGGPTMGHGIHQMDMLLDVLGDWAEVRAIARRQARRTQTEDLSLAHVSFASGAVASVVNSVLSPREESYLRFDFEHASVEVTHLYGYADDDWRITPASGWEPPGRGLGPEPEPGPGPGPGGPARPTGPTGPSGHWAQFDEVLACLAAGRRPPVTPTESRRTLSLIAAIYAASFTGQPVTPADLGPGSPFYDRMDGGKTPW